MSNHTILSIRKEMMENGSHWWDDDTLAFFLSKVGSYVYQGAGGIYFLSSEQPPGGERNWTVRKYDPVMFRISNASAFCELSESRAKELAKELAKG